ncbi:helix-turn-helix domain-containing protein [Quadrisphaera sp. KR29]|uniref:helix-turn-helix domain-containing protein n=1 Tax=Quadrisphaera sp. KR29 TaxID=3461391 RepID=UPI004044F7A3
MASELAPPPVPTPMAAAVEVFARRGYDEASVEEIAEAAGVSRSTFFRRFGSKEEVVFSDHEVLLAGLEAQLAASSAEAVAAVCDAAVAVFEHHVSLGEVSRARYRLVRGHPVLRDRELVMAHRYEVLFARHLVRALHDGDTAVGCAAAVVAVHNRVLRTWLDAEDATAADPADLRERLQRVAGLLLADRPGRGRVVVLGVQGEGSPAQIAEAVRTALQ